MAEPGSDLVFDVMAADADWAASLLARTEARVTLCRSGPDGAMGTLVQRRLLDEFDSFVTVPVDAQCLSDAADIGCRHGLRTLDAIHLAAAIRLPGVTFLSFDERQRQTAQSLGLDVIPI